MLRQRGPVRRERTRGPAGGFIDQARGGLRTWVWKLRLLGNGVHWLSLSSDKGTFHIKSLNLSVTQWIDSLWTSCDTYICVHTLVSVYLSWVLYVCMSVCQTALISSTQVAMVTASLLNFLVSVNIWVVSWWALLSLGGSYSQKCKAVCFHGYISATATSFPTFWSIIYVCGVNIVGVRASLSEDF